jgi:hypothetical protein
MDDEEIRRIIDVLERETNGESGKSRLFDAKPGRCSILLANRSGLLRWASVMLRAPQTQVPVPLLSVPKGNRGESGGANQCQAWTSTYFAPRSPWNKC